MSERTVADLSSSKDGAATGPIPWQLLLLPLAALAVWFFLFFLARTSSTLFIASSGDPSAMAIWATRSARVVSTGILNLVFLAAFYLATRNRAGAFVGWLNPVSPLMIAGAMSCGIVLALTESFVVAALSRGGTGPGGAGATPFELGMIALVYGVLIPAAEEFYFRGIALSWLRRWCSPLMTSILCAVAFGALHMRFLSNPGLAGGTLTLIFVALGLINAGLVFRLRSLWPAFASHAAFNLTLFAWAFPLLGFDPG